MSLKSTMFVANWKMNGTSFNFKEVSKVGGFLNKNLKKYKKSIIFCPPLPLLTYFSKKMLIIIFNSVLKIYPIQV